MMTIRVIAGAWLIFVVSFIWGVATIRNQVFPYQLLRQIADFVDGADGEATSVLEKFASDHGGRPGRFIYEFESVRPLRELAPLSISGLRQRRAAPRIFLSSDAPEGHRALFGAFDFEETLWGGILLDPEGRVVRRWPLSTDDLPGSMEPAYRKNMYGVNILTDGSILFQMQEDGGGIVKVDWCGDRQWILDGEYHHATTPADDGSFRTFAGSQTTFDHILTQVDIASGEVLHAIDMADVRAANPDTHIFDLQRQPDVVDRVHGNDIEALPSALAGRFPGFEAGDLLISFRIPNLVFVLDPDTLNIRRWRIGPWDRQHDPDWGADGRITVFSNNERGVGDHSKIVAIDPATFRSEVLLDGADHEFYSAVNGNHQITPGGGILVVSSTQGRIFEVDGQGRLVFDFVNLYDEPANKTLHVGDAAFLEAGYFDTARLPACD